VLVLEPLAVVTDAMVAVVVVVTAVAFDCLDILTKLAVFRDRSPKKIASSIFVDKCLLNGDTISTALNDDDNISRALEHVIPTMMEPL